MPPEQRSRKPEADERSDQFSLCATLYEALYQQRPFKTSKQEVLDRKALVTRPGPTAHARRPPGYAGPRVAAARRQPRARASIRSCATRACTPCCSSSIAIRSARAAGSPPLRASSSGWPRSRPSSRGSSRRRSTRRRRAAAPAPIASRSGGTPTSAPASSRSRRAAADAGAASAINVFAARVDHYAASWQAMYHDTCEATRIQSTQSQEAMDLRMACLDRRLDELGALVDVMHDADTNALRKAGEAVANLPPLADCADVKALRAVVRRPTEPAVAARVDALDGDLARLSALYAIGDTTKTLALADRVIAEARSDRLRAVARPGPLLARPRDRRPRRWPRCGRDVRRDLRRRARRRRGHDGRRRRVAHRAGGAVVRAAARLRALGARRARARRSQQAPSASPGSSISSRAWRTTGTARCARA